MASGDAPRPASGRGTPSLIDVISTSLSALPGRDPMRPEISSGGPVAVGAVPRGTGGSRAQNRLGEGEHARRVVPADDPTKPAQVDPVVGARPVGLAGVQVVHVGATADQRCQ